MLIETMRLLLDNSCGFEKNVHPFRTSKIALLADAFPCTAASLLVTISHSMQNQTGEAACRWNYGEVFPSYLFLVGKGRKPRTWRRRSHVAVQSLGFEGGEEMAADGQQMLDFGLVVNRVVIVQR